MEGKRMTEDLTQYKYPIRVAQIMGKHVTGGIKTVIMNYYENIDRSIIQFDFIVDSDSPLKDYSDIEKMGGRVFEVPSVAHGWKYIYECMKILKKEKYIIVHSYINTLNVFPMLAAKMAGVKVRIAENLSTAHLSERKTILKIILRPFARVFPTHIAANSKYAGRWMYGKKHMNECKYIYNAIDLDKYIYDFNIRDVTRKKYHWENKFVIGHIGRYHYQKNHEFLIDIFNDLHKKCNNAILALIGYGELKGHIFKKIKKLGLEEYVVDLGSREDIVQFYNAMDCFVLPSFYEGLPVVGIEAQATGLPCVISAEVTRETKITDIVDFIRLEDDLNVWSEAILKWKGYTRKNMKEQITSHGYNIVKEARILQDYYLDILKDI